MVVEAQQTMVLKGGVSTTPVNPDLNFRLRLDIGGANIRIQDKLITDEETGRFYVDRESGLDMDFEIVKTADNIPNESTITIWNLSDDTYDLIAKQKNQGLELYAAWSNDEFALMFRGYPPPRGVNIKKKGKDSKQTSSQGFLKQDYNASRKGQNDIPTVLTLVDGKATTLEAFMNKTYYGIVSTELILKDCIETLGIPIGVMAELEHKDIMGMQYRAKSITILNGLAKLLNFKWTITNGVFNLYTDKMPENPYGIKLNSENSSSPERQNEQFTVTNKNTGKTEIKNLYMVRTKLLPFLNPGTYCQCDFGTRLQGVKYIYKLKHKGNNYGTVAETEVYIVDV